MENFADQPDSVAGPLGRARRRILVAELPSTLRRVYHRVIEHTLAEGVPVDADALVIVLSALDEQSDDPLRFVPASVESLLWHEIASLCGELSVEIPQRCAAAVFAVVAICLADQTLGARAEDPEAIFGVLRQLSGV